MSAKNKSSSKKPGSVRIIAGEWRSRKLPVADIPGLRPTGDRARETLFNWLQPQLPGSVCVDLFAGSGALGFEAASRGAKQVILVEQNTRIARQLQTCIEQLNADQVTLRLANGLLWLDQAPKNSVDILFADPPFDDRLHQQVVDKVHQSACVKAGGLIYLESPAGSMAPVVPVDWLCRKDKVIGQVRMQVFLTGNG